MRTVRTARRSRSGRSMRIVHMTAKLLTWTTNSAGLFAWLKARQLYDNTVILVVSDHGESLGEHGEREHGFFVYNSTVHIPLIVKPQKGSGIRPGRVARPVETTAIAPTLLAMAGIKDAELEKQFQSASLFAPRVQVMLRRTARLFIRRMRLDGVRCMRSRQAVTTTSMRRRLSCTT